MSREDLFVWLDLEMTGLDVETCAIVEIATLLTDDELQVVAEGPSLVIHQPAEVLDAMADNVRELHTASGLLQQVASSTISLEQAEQQTLAFVTEHCEPGAAPLCGNSIWRDRQFLERYMRKLTASVHYRNIDVSSIKALVQRWYPERFARVPKKAGTHRALDDIRDSIAELQWYRKELFPPRETKEIGETAG